MTEKKETEKKETEKKDTGTLTPRDPLHGGDRLDDARFVAGVTQSLTEQVDELPETVRLRLQQSRRRAAAISEKGIPWVVSVRRPALLASIAVVALAVFFGILTRPQVPQLPVSSELEFAAAQDVDVLEQLEFLAWLEQEHPDAG